MVLFTSRENKLFIRIKLTLRLYIHTYIYLYDKIILYIIKYIVLNKDIFRINYYNSVMLIFQETSHGKKNAAILMVI